MSKQDKQALVDALDDSVKAGIAIAVEGALAKNQRATQQQLASTSADITGMKDEIKSQAQAMEANMEKIMAMFQTLAPKPHLAFQAME